jgi:MFS transporter, DHA1 family, inner membrane transport protein
MLVLCVLFVDRDFSEYERPVAAPVRQGSGRVAVSTGTTWLLVGATILAGFVIYGYLGLYPTFLRTDLGFSPAEAAFASSCYGVGGFLSVLGGWLGDRFEYRRILKLAFCVTTLCGGLLFTELGHSIYLHALLSFVFGSTASGVLFANLSTGIIRSIHPSKSPSFGAGLYVSAFYIPAAFAGYVLAVLKGYFGWSLGSGIQLVGCSIGALILVQLAKTPRFGKAEADTDFDAESGIGTVQAH